MLPAIRFRMAISQRPSWFDAIARWSRTGQYFKNLERWYATIAARSAFQGHVAAIPIV